MKVNLLYLFLLSIEISYAKPISYSVPTPVRESAGLTAAVANLNSIDANTDDLLQLKRKLELEKAQAELKKIRNSGVISTNPAYIPDTAQTTVSGVAISHDGRSMGWLQFADGGSLMVNLGSRVGKYTVTQINMTGIRLSYWTGHKKLARHNIFLKRAYYSAEKPKNQAAGNINPFFNPSPVITGANDHGTEMVPPIVPLK